MTPVRCACLLEAVPTWSVCICPPVTAALRMCAQELFQRSPPLADQASQCARWEVGGAFSFACRIPHSPTLHSQFSHLDCSAWCGHPCDCPATLVWSIPTSREAALRVQAFSWRAASSPFSSQSHTPAAMQGPKPSITAGQ